MRTLGKNDWLQEGLAILNTEDFAGITIDNLCRRLSITKGSFYHHFKNFDNYIEELMNFWMKENTLELIRLTNLSTPKNKIKKLHELAKTVDHKAELRIRAWGFSHPLIKEHVQKVDLLRLEYLISLNLSSGHDPDSAKYLAMVDYSTLVGFQQLFSELSTEELSGFWKFSSHLLLSEHLTKERKAHENNQ
jgi:AcrR family transcriptional regulator